MILAIDPGNIESGYVFTKDNLEVIEKGEIKRDYFLIVSKNKEIDLSKSFEIGIPVSLE